MLDAGADKVSVNSSAVRSPDIINKISGAFGNQFVVVAIDAKMENNNWTVYVNGGRIPTNRELFSWAREAQDRGAGEILFTSMNHDGTKNGFACDTIAMLSEELSIPVIASGGAGEKKHFTEVFTTGKADAALAASIFHYNEVPIIELKRYLTDNQITVR